MKTSWLVGSYLKQQADAQSSADSDDTLILLFGKCHPALNAVSDCAHPASGRRLTTTEVARAFLVSEATATRRITRAKQLIKDSGIPFRLPGQEERADVWRPCSMCCI